MEDLSIGILLILKLIMDFIYSGTVQDNSTLLTLQLLCRCKISDFHSQEISSHGLLGCNTV
jgi:hypothetical protein